MEETMAVVVKWSRSTIAAAFALLTFGIVGTAQQSQEPPTARARAVWEQAIEAKGGRERLYGISNVVLSSVSHWGIRGFNRITVSYETLLVLPSRLWDWSDERPSKFGLSLLVVDLDRDYAQVVYEDLPGSGPQPLPGRPGIGHVRRITTLQAISFLATRWVKPEVLRARPARWRLKAIDELETQVGEQMYVFYLDRSTHLPFRVLIKTPTPYGLHEEEYRLADYRDVSGLQLPHAVSHKHLGTPGGVYKERIQYQLNVDYDEELFRKPPSLSGGPKGWQGKN